MRKLKLKNYFNKIYTKSYNARFFEKKKKI